MKTLPSSERGAFTVDHLDSATLPSRYHTDDDTHGRELKWIHDPLGAMPGMSAASPTLSTTSPTLKVSRCEWHPGLSLRKRLLLTPFGYSLAGGALFTRQETKPQSWL